MTTVANPHIPHFITTLREKENLTALVLDNNFFLREVQIELAQIIEQSNTMEYFSYEVYNHHHFMAEEEMIAALEANYSITSCKGSFSKENLPKIREIMERNKNLMHDLRFKKCKVVS